MRQPISRAGHGDCHRSDAGFTLVEVLCAVAILAIVAALVMPVLPRGTSGPQLEALALGTATILRGDRIAAIRRRTDVATEVDALARTIRSGASPRAIDVPEDVAFDTLLAGHCKQQSAGRTIRFLASGMSCGGVIALSRAGRRYEVRVNWLTGGIDVVPLNRS